MAKKRASLSKRTRFEIFKRDRFTCQYCGTHPPDVILELDHVIAIANGGDDAAHNLVTSCKDCNRGKSAVPLDAAPRQFAANLEEQQELLEQMRLYNEFLLEERQQAQEWVDYVERYWVQKAAGYFSDTKRLVEDERHSIATFLKRLTVASILDAVDIAFGKYGYASQNKLFRYFCGICWRRIKGDAR